MADLINSSLIIVPSPLDEEEIFSSSLLELIRELDSKNISYHLLVESEKIVRRRWIKSGLERDKISQFIEYNEHNQLEKNTSLIQKMKLGEKFLLISDEGLPTFFDPGQKLIAQMHLHKLKVGALEVACSPVMALILSGFNANQFRMLGFPPVKLEERLVFFQSFVQFPETCILMDTAYRLKLTLEQLANMEKLKSKNQYFLALDLARVGQEYFYGNIDKLLKSVDFERKRDFILIKAEKN